MDSQVLVALALSLVGGLSTSLGALLVVLNPTPNLKMLGLLQGFAAGLMMSISFFDLAHNALNSIGFLKGNLWFFSGVIFFAIIANFIPEPTVAPLPDVKSKKKNGVEGRKDSMKNHRRQVLFSGIITAVGISLHNFPEGMAVFLGSIKGLRVGLNLALAIALHNIPEGVAVALPVYFATQSKWKAFKLATISGLAEPLGVIIVAYLFPSSLNPEILEGLLGAVGGVMAFLTLHEMLPLAFIYGDNATFERSKIEGIPVMEINNDEANYMLSGFSIVEPKAQDCSVNATISEKLPPVVKMMRKMNYIPGLGLGRNQQGLFKIELPVQKTDTCGLGYVMTPENRAYERVERAKMGAARAAVKALYRSIFWAEASCQGSFLWNGVHVHELIFS